MTMTINGREYKVEVYSLSANGAVAADLRSRGFDGVAYSLTGKRGARYLAYRTAAGEFSIVCSLR